MTSALRRSAAHVFVGSLAVPVLDDADAHHLGRVLRLRAGEPVSVADGTGAWRLCRWHSPAALEPDGDIVAAAPAGDEVTVGFAIPKGDRAGWIVEKSTEIGVDRLVVLHTERSVTTWTDGRAERHLLRLRAVARAAAMQSRRLVLPIVEGPVVLAGSTLVGAAVAMADPDGASSLDGVTTILIGPEGGWSEAELGSGRRRVGLGRGILRVETAAVVAATHLSLRKEQSFKVSSGRPPI